MASPSFSEIQNNSSSGIIDHTSRPEYSDSLFTNNENFPPFVCWIVFAERDRK